MKGFESLEKADFGTIFGHKPGQGRAAAETKLLSARQKSECNKFCCSSSSKLVLAALAS